MVQFIREIEPSQRPRERLAEYGVRALSDAELIAILMRTGRKGYGAVAEAHSLLAELGGLAGIARLGFEDLVRRPGLGPAKAATMLAALEIGQRMAKAEMRAAVRLDQPRVAGEFLVRRLQRENREVFGFLSLDDSHRFVADHELSLGTRNQAPVDAAELFRRAVLDRAKGVLLFHNHPSGNLEPSQDDLELTRRLANGGAVVGVTVLDHLIVAGCRWLSLRSTHPNLFVG